MEDVKKGAKGIFDDKKAESEGEAPREPRRELPPQPAQPEKQNFPSVNDGLKKQVAQVGQRNRALAEKSTEEKAVDGINSQMSGNKDQVDFDEANAISDEDVKLAEELLFNGYVEKEVIMPHIPTIKHVICSVTAEEMNLIDDIIYEEAKKHSKADGTTDISESAIQTLRSSLYLAMSYKGSNGSDFVKDAKTLHIDIIKKAMKALSDRYVSGELESIDGFKTSIMEAVKKRAVRVRQFGTPLLDFLSSKKFEFDNKLFAVMNTEKIIPKS